MGRWNGIGLVLAAVLFGACGAPEPDSDLGEVGSNIAICGNKVCDGTESCASCPGDCGRCTTTHCGDGVCSRTKESCTNCPQDCGVCPGCGNHVCDTGETCSTCPGDCGSCSRDFCGNGVCSRRESCTSCARDCCPSTPQCSTGSDCAPTGNECIAATCTSGQCGTQNVSSGTAISAQTPGDCQKVVCNGSGGTTSVADDSDVPADDGNPCTAEACSSGSPLHVPLSAESPCTGGVCDGNGTCVGCLSATDCPAPPECEVAVCTMNTCTTSDAAQNTPCNNNLGICNMGVCDPL